MLKKKKMAAGSPRFPTSRTVLTTVKASPNWMNYSIIRLNGDNVDILTYLYMYMAKLRIVLLGSLVLLIEVQSYLALIPILSHNRLQFLFSTAPQPPRESNETFSSSISAQGTMR